MATATEQSARERFLEQYAVIRRAEGRGSADPEYYRALPFRDLTGRNSGQWAIRARTFQHFVREIVAPMEGATDRPLRILDVGAGTCWLTWRLHSRGHFAVGTDIFVDPLDGLGAATKFPHPPQTIAATFDELPFAGGSFDLVVFNASIHYSADYSRTLREVRRVLTAGGKFAILDSPIYKKPEHGKRMREERQEIFERTYGFRSEALGSIEYLDELTLETLARDLGIQWTRKQPWYGWRWAWRPWKARLQRKRPPSRFCLLLGSFSE